MARGRRKEYSRDVEPLDPKQHALPAVCPLCGMSFAHEMLTHLQSHAPGELCQCCDGKEKGWRLDTDGAMHFRPDVGVFFCSWCGRYATANVREEVKEADPPS
jgi:hypothetical protein